MTWPFLDVELPYGFAHRGGNESAPENTVAAFQHAQDLGYTHLETDVHVTRDGVLVAFHDAALERVTGRSGEIGDHDWGDLRGVDLGGGTTIPTMEELLRTFPEARFNVDPKVDGSVEPLADLIAAHNAVDRVCVGSFSDDRVAALRQRLGPALCTSPGPRGLLRLTLATLADSRLAASSSVGRDYGAVQIPPSFGLLRLSAKQVDRYHQQGLQVHVWTINDAAEMHRLLDLGVDAVMTDKTSLLMEVLEQRRQRQ